MKRRSDESTKRRKPTSVCCAVVNACLPARASFLPLLLTSFLPLLLSSPLHAQAIDSLATDTVQTVPATPDSAQAAVTDSIAAVGFLRAAAGRRITNRLPARRAALEVTELLRRRPGSFLYAFGSVGWPEGWSWRGLSPQRTLLTLDGRPFTNLITGRPRFDLLPLMLFDPPGVATHHLGAPVSVQAVSRAYYSPRPLTELRYWTDTDGLQSILALHVQSRRLSLFGRPGVFQILGAYGGRAADGDYPRGEYGGSQLRRQRQIYGRLRYLQRNWSLEITNFYNRRHVGAHGGVQPIGGIFETIYIPVGADLLRDRARRQTIRNDLSITGRARLVRGLPATSLNAHWTTTTFRYANPEAAALNDSLTFSGNLFGLRFLQPFVLGSHDFQLSVHGTSNGVDSDGSNGAIRRPHVSLRDSFRVLGTPVRLEAAFHAADDLPAFTGAVSLAHSLGPLRLFGGIQSAGQTVSWISRHGFGPLLMPLGAPPAVIGSAAGGEESALYHTGSLPVGRVSTFRSGFSWDVGPFDVSAFAFGQRLSNALDYIALSGDSARAVVASRPLLRIGAAGTLGWRKDAGRGFYFVARPTFTRLLSQETNLQNRIDSALPAFFLSGRLGLRYLLFRGDLDLRAYLQGCYWTAFRSRTLHAPTGLLVLPRVNDGATGGAFGPSGTLDLVVEAGIRSATVFLSLQNILSDSYGRLLMRGTLLVPTYPLTSWRLRFGVYWPIQN